MAGLIGFVAVSDQPFSAFDFQDCSWQKVEINGTTYSSQEDLEAAVLQRGGEQAWNDISSNVASWKVEQGDLYFKPANCRIQGES